MALIPYQPQDLSAQQSDGNILLTWTGSLGSTSYDVQRSLDGINFLTVASPTGNQYLDAQPGIGIKYYYRVAGISISGAFAIATLTFSGQPSPGDTVSIANVLLTAGTDFVIGGTVPSTISNLVSAINTAPGLEFVVTADNVGLIITITAYNIGPEGNGLEFNNALTNVVGSPFTNGLPQTQGAYSSVVSMVAANPGEMSLGELRLRSQQCADRVGSEFVGTAEWNAFIRLACYELYDLLITCYEDYNIAPYVYINTNATLQNYPLPDGINYLGGVFGGTSGSPASRFYKLAGVDLGVNTSNNAWVTINRYDYIDRNAYVYPNSTSTIYGVYNMRYRVMGTNINFIPTPAGNQQIRLTYVPVLPALLLDTDLTNIGVSGWLRYVIVRAAKYALDKEEGVDTTKLDNELIFLKNRIEVSAINRDVGQPDTISETRQVGYGYNGWGSGGNNAGW